MSRNVELSEFLRRCRGRITPESAGLPERGAYRRVPGLRREEVAQLAGVSTDYCTNAPCCFAVGHTPAYGIGGIRPCPGGAAGGV
jgi:hypothetical protein